MATRRPPRVEVAAERVHVHGGVEVEGDEREDDEGRAGAGRPGVAGGRVGNEARRGTG